MWKKWTRIICGVLTAAMLLTELPMNAMAASNTAIAEAGDSVYGDANGDGVLDSQDISAILQYIVENNPSDFQPALADVTGDGSVDLKDLLAVRKRMADLDKEILSVSFYDGERLIDTLFAEKDSPLSAVPTVGKSSKANAVLLGYYTDQACTVPFYAENPVTENMKVYTKYQEMGSTEELNFTSFAQMDQSPDISFRIRRVSGNISPESAAVLDIKDGSDPVALEIVGPDADGFYTVKAPEGFRRGSSYELTLAEGWVFDGKDETIRTAAFSIEMEEVAKLRMNDAIIYIEDTDTIDYEVDGNTFEELTTNEVTDEGGNIIYGAFDATQFADIEYDDILCVYVGVHPLERNPKTSENNMEPAVYVKVTGIGDGKVSFAALGKDDQIRMYDIPDNFPVALSLQSVSGGDADDMGSVSGGDADDAGSVSGGDAGDMGSVSGGDANDTGNVKDNDSKDKISVSGSNVGNAGSVSGGDAENEGYIADDESVRKKGRELEDEDTIDSRWDPDFNADSGTVDVDVLFNALDLEMYRLMMGDESIELDDIEKKISIGDFITIYTSSEEIESEESLYYARITGYDEETGEVSYERTTKQAILESMDIYQKVAVDGGDLVTEEQKEEIEALLLSQLEKSGFAEDAAYLLSDMITKTDGFRNNMSIQDFLLTDENGNPLSDEEIELLNLGSSFELSDDIKLKVELITEGDQLHFGGGVQLAVQVEAEFEVEVEDGKVVIKLSASFVQEAALDPSVRGSIVTKEILFIPVPIGVKVNAAIDIRSYTAFSFAAEIYTVAEEDKSVWEKFKAICEDPKEILGLEGIPEGLRAGLEQAGDIMTKIDEIKAKIKEASETADKIKGYEEDLETLWNLVETNGLTTREEWEEMEETLGKTNVASELLDMMDLTTETDISTEYLDSMHALIDKYVETVEKETDWVQLVNQEIFAKDIYISYTPIVIAVNVDFVVRADMSIAIGSNLEYEVGKRYNFWFKIGLFKPTAGSSSMDLLDERFAFQFYVMGRLGLKAGIRAKLAVGLGSSKFASVGIAAELGPYVKLYGFYVYEYTKLRPVNTQNWTSKERMAGALYLDFGLYFMLGFEANALGNLFEYSYDFLDEEVSLLTAGEPRYYYENAYKPEEDEMVIVRDEDGNSSNGITMVVPDSTIALSYVDLDTGWRGSEAVDYSRYNFTVSNPNFKIDPSTGVISVDVPENTRYMECDLTVTYLYGKLAFSQYDMSVTIPLVWTNLSTDELKEFYTASVRVGNDQDGYQTVWRKRVLKNQQYDLPSDEEIKAMIGWSDAKFTGGTGYGSQETTGLTLIQDTVYNYNVDYKTYSVTVDDIQNADGSTRSETYTAKYGEYFDFSDLAESGMDIPGEVYTKFAGVKTDATIMAAGSQQQVIDLTEKISGQAAVAIDAGIRARAEYVDDGVMARFEFTGIDHEGVEQRIRKGTIPDLGIIGEAEQQGSEAGLNILNITPDCNLRVNAPIVYQVIFGELIGPKATVVFHENGGSDVNDIIKTVGGYLGVLPVPEKKGYSFDGWYTDNGTFRNRYEERKMTEGGAELYAKWTANEYKVTFHVNGGNELDAAEQTKTVTYDSTYGSLPAPTRTSYAFIGWFTAADGGSRITADTAVAVTAGQTLYAHWRLLKQIPSTVFDFGEAEDGVYSKGMTHEVIYGFDAGGENFTQNSFTFKYMRQGNSEYETGLPINAGTYNATVSRPADDFYDKFEYTYTAVITIEKAVRTIGAVEVEAEDKGYTFVKLALIGDGGIDDLSSEATFTYQAKSGSTVVSRSADRDSYIYDLLPATSYDITVKVTDDPNYEDAESTEGTPVSTMEAPTDSWVAEGNYDTSWYDDYVDEDVFTLKTAEDLAGFSYLLTKEIDFSGKTVKLEADVDLRGHAWYPIARYATRTTTTIWGGTTTQTVNSWFRGTFDGGNHKVTGVYVNSGDTVGLFGQGSSSAIIKNVLLDHSYIRGTSYVGGIVGYMSRGRVDNCVNYARVIGTSTNSDSASTGGIIGYSADDAKDKIVAVNCVNYGSVQGSGNHTGGIVGYLYSGEVRNNANYGKVSGVSCVGGIVGEGYRKTAKSYNNFTVGTIRGTGNFIGAAIGRINGNDGDADQCYYLWGSAKCNGSNRNAVGTDTKAGSLDDGSKNFNNAYFSSPTSRLSRTCESGAGNDNLKGAMNRWVTRCNKDNNIYSEWVEGGPDGYPIPKDSPIPDAVDTRVR